MPKGVKLQLTDSKGRTIKEYALDDFDFNIEQIGAKPHAALLFVKLLVDLKDAKAGRIKAQ